MHDIDSFGIGGADANVAIADSADFANVSEGSTRESTVLTSTASRDISQGIEAIEAEEEAARIAAEEAARAEEEARIAAAEQAKAEQEAAAARDAASDAVASLPEVDFSVGKEAFVSEWTSRINAYLAGSPLAGQGATFAEAAWSNGVDPRWSPAISNTESSKGAHCFLPYNAWGWGDKSWSSWEEAINAHVAGLANGYGYSITYANAAKYCPPNTDHWFLLPHAFETMALRNVSRETFVPKCLIVTLRLCRRSMATLVVPASMQYAKRSKKSAPCGCLVKGSV